MTVLIRSLPQYDQVIAKRVLLRNSYWAHCESILIAGLTDLNIDIRTFAITKIIESRVTSVDQRQFNIPKNINFSAEHYIDLINWEEEIFTPPPMVQYLSNDQLISGIDTPLALQQFPCHTQAVERGVQLVTKASINVCGYAARQGYILNTLASRDRMPTFRNKRDYPV